MYLKRLEIQGYKSFAGRTTFGFDGGITAIVGPNGSGKSNIADAIRWVLGEQSYSALRAKRTEDLIFSGSAHRARVGMAEASLVFDNASHWLPIDFSEVTIMRRAARSGENEYHLNGNRVRLRDIVELLTRAGLGRNASAVIGQGQVDAALSLRPEERRSLLEEAAGVRIHIDKRDEALARLEETRRNLERLNDIIGEIAPRLETLRRQSERTREHERTKAELDERLLLWYGHQWERHQDRLARAEEKHAERSHVVEEHRSLIDRTTSQRDSLRSRQQALRDEIRQKREDAERVRRQIESLRRRLAVSQERVTSLSHQRDQVQADIAAVQERRERLRTEVARQEEELAVLVETIAAQQSASTASKAELAAAEAALRSRRDELEHARATVFEIATAQAAARNRITEALRRQADLEEEAAEQRGALADAETRASAAEEALLAAEQERQQVMQDLSETEGALRQAEDDLAATLTRLDALRSQRDAARETHQRLRTQHEVLQRARSQGSHLRQGAQAVMRENMPGVLGTVANLIRVPEELETAMEAALGSHLQDVVVKTWNDALACVDLLKRRNRGQATFLPLDYIRPRRPVPSPRAPGVRGTASSLVSVEPVYRPICDLLLGNIVIVDDLQAGRRALGAERRLQRAVTLDGDVVETRGIVRGGARPRGRSFLAQEREWRALPAQLASAQHALSEAEGAVRAEDENQLALRAEARQQAQRLQACRQAMSQHEQRGSSLRQRYDRLAQEVSWLRTQKEQGTRVLAALKADEAEARAEIAVIEQNLAEATERVEALRDQLDQDDLSELRRRAAECETALAVSQRSKQAQEQFIASQREALARADAEMQTKEAQLLGLAGQQTEVDQVLESARTELDRARQAQRAEAEPLATAEAELQATERERERLEQEEQTARHELQTHLTELNRLSFERERVREEMEELQRQMESELGPVDMPDVGQPQQLRLSLGTGITPLPQVAQLPDGLTAGIKELRARLRRLAPVNPSAPAEYDQVLQRHQFLTDQVMDLNRAAEATREIIGELNRVIRDRFTETFGQVAHEFSGCFRTLFNGGSARLILTDPDDPAESGIEIIAQPPGKRSQNLSLLSGGERALTAVSLLFALLKVNPLPFCVLDEVDAMLDESNVHRFRAFLEGLSQTTQFLIITHNRATVEAASTLYGVSMAREGMSQVLSLSLADKSDDAMPEATSAA